jgi:tRNA dimethylallyltransferase
MAAPRLIAVVGPTAAGKTALGIRIAERLGGEVISCDSQQVYRGMDIGTGKATAEERARVSHHLLDVVDPDQAMTAARYVELADAAIADVVARGRSPVLCGGTGLYYRSLLYGLFSGPAADEALRARLDEEAEVRGVESLWARLAAVDPEASTRIDRRDRVRLIRALEVFELTGVPISRHQKEHDHRRRPLRYPVRAVGLGPPRAALGERIDVRVEAMVASGLVDEVRALNARGYACSLRAFSAIGYREICSYLHGKYPLEEAARKIKQATRRYARRQLAWFRAEPTVTWYTSGVDVDVDELAAWA